MPKLVSIPIPLAGLNTVNIGLPMDSGYARELTNYSIINGRLRKRAATSAFVEYTVTAPTIIPVWFNNQVGNQFGISFNGDIFNLLTGAVTGTIGAGVYYNRGVAFKHISLNLVVGIGAPRLQAGPFAAWSFTTLGITAANIIAGCSHKGRLYVSAGGAIEYSSVGAIAGTMAGSFDVTQFMDGQSVIYMASITIQPGAGAENVLVVVGDKGKILVYQGDYPASSTWNLIGTFDMPPSLGPNNMILLDGDLLIATTSYPFWVRDLFTGGAQTAYDNSPVLPIENLWAASYFGLANDQSLNHAHAWYNRNIDAIIFQTRASGEIDDPLVHYVYFRKYRAWAVWNMIPMLAPIRERSDTSTSRIDYFGCGDGTYKQIRQMLDETPPLYSYDYDEIEEDEYYQIVTSWKTPYFEAFAGKVNKVVGVRPFYEDTESGQFTILRSIFDYSDYNAPNGFYDPAINPGNYSEATIDMPANPSNQYSQYAGLTGLGGGVSFQFTQSGTIEPASIFDSHRQDIYAATAYIEDGGIFI